MDFQKTRGSEKIAFEIVNSNEGAAIFKRVLPVRGKKVKDVKKIEHSFPTASICYFTLSDFENLKRIEAEVHKKIEINKSSTSIVGHLRNWFEIE